MYILDFTYFIPFVKIFILTPGYCTCADPDSLERGGPTFFLAFFFAFLCSVNEGREDPNTTLNGPSSASQRTDDGPTLNDVDNALNATLIAL